MITNKSGITIRLAVEDLRVMGRATQGVRLINLRDGDTIASVAKIENGSLDEKNELVQDFDNEGVVFDDDISDNTKEVNSDENNE
jgi:DNA gyrase subunit A